MTGDAKQNLIATEYEKFLQETSYQSETSTVRKWMCIGSSYIRLKPIANLLPPTFSVIYKLSTLDTNSLDKLATENVLKPSVTLKEIENSIKTLSVATPKPTVVLKFDPQIHEMIFVELMDMLQKLSAQNLINLKMNTDAEDLYQSAHNTTKKVA